MNKKYILIVLILAVVVGGWTLWVSTKGFPSFEFPKLKKQEKTKEQACINSGGKVSLSLCCKATSNFPNTCLVGPCGCALDYSHKIKVCDCGEEKCFDGHKCAASDEVLRLLEDLKQETGIGFSEARSVEFKWVVSVTPKVQEVTVKGNGFEVERISTEQYEKVDTFFKGKGFEVDPYNATAGTVSEQTGYEKDQIVCAVSGGATGYKEAEGQWIPAEPNLKDVEIKCGKEEVVL